jgi:threonine/homoserine/homoserine lactone efflux protein
LISPPDLFLEPNPLAYLLKILPAHAAYLVAVVSPGPAIMAIVSTSMTQGRKAGSAWARNPF